MSATNAVSNSKRKAGAREKAPKAPRKPRTAKTAATAVSPEQRRTMIAESAYLRAERRGFSGGDPIADWLASEREVDELLSRQ